MASIYGTIYGDNDTDSPDGNFHPSIYGTDQADISIFGKEGDDVIFGQGGDDIIDAGPGNDRVLGEDGNDTILGRTGNDFLHGGEGNDVLYGEQDNDELYGWAGNDILWGGDGNDRLDGYAISGTEYDTLKGGNGSDVFVLGGWWGASYQGDGYATITDWEWQYDYIEASGSASQYSLQQENLVGGSALDTGIYYNNNLLGIVQDSTNVDIGRDFRFV